MIAYKFLAAGARGPLTQVVWPAIGEWHVAELPIVVGKRGIHACTKDQLAHWLHDELWEVELAGAHEPGLDCIVAERARLSRRIPFDAARFARACIDHVGAVPDAEDALRYGYPAVAAFMAAATFADVAGYTAERAWQSAWIAREYSL
ncbi:MAG: hypothetical protein QM831_32015 [Kofleriaceae bacterium]